MSVKVTSADMRLIPKILKYTSPDEIPLSFTYGDRVIRGIPTEFSPSVRTDAIDCNILRYEIEGENASGLHIRVQYTEYRDFPVTEWVAFISNNGTEESDIISNVSIGGNIECGEAFLIHGNGDTRKSDGYTFFEDKVDKKIKLTPNDGTSCLGAFPYMTLRCGKNEIRAAIGWPTKWMVQIEPCEGGVSFLCGQDRCHTTLLPGECFRTPRLNLMIYHAPDKFRGINLWRRWYISHILPRDNGQPMPPNLCLHLFCAEGKPEFTGATEKNQLHALSEYLRRGMKPDIWWIDAGWYPCNYDWPRIGSWRVDTDRFPDRLGPIGKACHEAGAKLLLWFEPERVRAGEELEIEHPEWLLCRHDEQGQATGDRLLDLGNPEALEWLIARVDSIIKDSGVDIYRQDFNFDPLPIWIASETEDRIGITENKHAQGYLAYWDALIARNPGLWIDSCASGGRRNDLESMRRAVPLHYTDVGYGDHPIKQKQHREMFEWIPYFRAHNMNWYDPEKNIYDRTGRPADAFAYHAAIAPSMTDMCAYNADDEYFAFCLERQKIWREAAELMMKGDYYPITEYRGDIGEWCVYQFDCAEAKRGFVHLIRNAQAKQESFVLRLPCVRDDAVYTFRDSDKGGELSVAGASIKYGIRIELKPHEAIILFYSYT